MKHLPKKKWVENIILLLLTQKYLESWLPSPMHSTVFCHPYRNPVKSFTVILARGLKLNC